MTFPEKLAIQLLVIWLKLVLFACCASAVTIDHAVVCPQGTTDCTAAVQKLIDAELAAATPARPAVIDFTAGVYPIKSLFVLHNHLKPVRRISGANGTSLKLLPRQPKFTRLLTVRWDSAQDSPLCSIHSIDFDLNKGEQDWDGSYGLEHQGGLFLHGCANTNPKAGRLWIDCHSLTFHDSCSDGAYIYHQVFGTIIDCDGRDLFRGSLIIDGREVDLVVIKFTTTSPTIKNGLRSGIQLEPHANSRQSVTLIDCDVTVLDLDIGNAKSDVTLVNVKTSLSCNVYNYGTLRAYRSTFNGGVFFTHVGDSVYADCEFIGTDGTFIPNTYQPKCCVWVQWVAGGVNNNQVLRLDRCNMRAAEAASGVYGVRVNTTAPGDGNVCDVSGCHFAPSLAVAISMEKSGSTWRLTGNTIDATTAFYMKGTPARPYDVTLTSNRLGPNVKKYLDTTYDLPQNKFRHVDSVVPASQNVIVSTRPIGTVGLNQYSGGRTIISDAVGPPVRQAGLPGDVYRDSSGARWRVKLPAYDRAQWEAE